MSDFFKPLQKSNLRRKMDKIRGNFEDKNVFFG